MRAIARFAEGTGLVILVSGMLCGFILASALRQQGLEYSGTLVAWAAILSAAAGAILYVGSIFMPKY